MAKPAPQPVGSVGVSWNANPVPRHFISKDFVPKTATPAKTKRVVLRPLDGPDFITDIWTDVEPPKLTNNFGEFRLLRAVPGYVLYGQVAPVAVA